MILTGPNAFLTTGPKDLKPAFKGLTEGIFIPLLIARALAAEPVRILPFLSKNCFSKPNFLILSSVRFLPVSRAF